MVFKLRLLSALILSVACGGSEADAELDTFGTIENDGTSVSNDQLQLLASIFYTYKEFPIQFVSITIDQTANTDHCDDQSDACTFDTGTYDRPTSHIYTPWDAQHYAEWINAELVAHEMCHAFYHITTGDGDPNHTHHECFARDDGEYQSYAGEIGTATFVAKDFAAADTENK